MSREYFTRTFLYLVKLKIFEWIKFPRTHLQLYIKFRVTELVHMQECGDDSYMYNYQQIQLLNNSLMASCWVRLTWLDCTLYTHLAPVVPKTDSTIHWISIRETNYAIHWIEIYMMDSVIHLLNN